MKNDTSIFWNGATQNHDRRIRNLLKDAKRFDCMVAFARWSGFKQLQKLLVKRLKDGMSARLHIGLDHCHTEPKVLKQLLALKRKYQIEIFVSASDALRTFHPKVYRFDNGKNISLIVGSANLTYGGLFSNQEVSAVFSLKSDNHIPAYMKALERGEDVIKLTPENLALYEVRFAAYHVLRGIAEKKIAKSLKAKVPGLEALRTILDTMKEGGKDSEFLKQVRIRKKARAQARTLLNKFENGSPLTRSVFLKQYSKLTGDLWHSGGLQRSKTKIAKTPEIFQRIIRVAAQPSSSIADKFESMRTIANLASGIGPNLLTEILHTYDNGSHAVMNQNSVAGMKLAGYLAFPERPTRSSVDGRLFEEFCRDADAVRRNLGLKNLSELDAVFNHAYWQ
jgi:HKD family nuclease